METVAGGTNSGPWGRRVAFERATWTKSAHFGSHIHDPPALWCNTSLTQRSSIEILKRCWVKFSERGRGAFLTSGLGICDDNVIFYRPPSRATEVWKLRKISGRTIREATNPTMHHPAPCRRVSRSKLQKNSFCREEGMNECDAKLITERNAAV